MKTMKNFTAIILALTLTLSLAAMANADVVNFGDSTIAWAGWGTPQENYKDVIGIPNFTHGSATYTTGPGLFTLTSVGFTFTADKYESAYNSLTSGDLFVNTNNDSSWDYAVRLNKDLTADVFAIDLGYNSPTGYVMSHASGDYRDNHPIGADVSGLTAIASGSWSGLPSWPGPGATGEVTVSGLGIDFSTLSLSYTVSCANDVVFEAGLAKTPIPGAIWLLGSGLFGLVGMRRRLGWA